MGLVCLQNGRGTREAGVEWVRGEHRRNRVQGVGTGYTAYGKEVGFHSKQGKSHRGLRAAGGTGSDAGVGKAAGPIPALGQPGLASGQSRFQGLKDSSDPLPGRASRGRSRE